MKTKAKRSVQSPNPLAAFWDTSGIVPLCCFQPLTAQARQAARAYGRQIVWWGSAIEAISSLNRLVRDGHLTVKDSKSAFVRLDYLRRRWHELQPTDEVRELSERLLSRQKFRAADALQLAAALIWCHDRPRERCFIGADNALSEAAEAEGFVVIRL